LEEKALNRRVVVTGIGLVCGSGNTTEEVWSSLLAGRSAIGSITRFDVSAFPVRIASEIKNFDPLKFFEKKEVKKMDVFIHYAVAAAQEAVDDSGLRITEENATRIGSYIGSGIGGFGVIEREHEKFLKGGPGKISLKGRILLRALPALRARTR
jgi:3-oxoacyl-[acyl-carrier-protein] synthase II